MAKLLPFVALVAALLGLSGSAPAGELAGVKMSDRTVVAGKPLVLNGMGVRKATFLKVKVYVAGLYLEKKSGDAAVVISSTQVKRLVLQFVRDVTRDQIAEAWQEGFEKNGGKELPRLRARIRQLNGWMTDFHSGDALTFTFLPGSGVEVQVRGTAVGVLPGDDFARTLLSIWLGSQPPNADLKSGLLGEN
ncbi:MAG TPA: chalcone isomerase family protein [Polyangiaceae bacterium]